MADNELVAAILAAGMLPPLSPPSIAPDGSVGAYDQAQLVRSILHAVGLYRSILEGLATQPKASAEAVHSGAGANRHCRPVGDQPAAAYTPSLIRSSSPSE